MKYLLTFSIALLFTTSVHAQRYKPAIITLTNKEQIECFVHFSPTSGLITHIVEYDLLDREASNFIHFKWDLQGEVQEYSLNKIKAVYVEGQYYEKLYVQHPNKRDRTDCLLPRIIAGSVNLYQHSFFAGSPLGRTIFYLQTDKILHDVRRRNFKKDMAYFFREDPELVDQIKSGELKYADLQTIVQKFNSSYKAVKHNNSNDYYVE